MYFIDLDLKPLEKLEKHYEKDKKIVSCYSQKLYGKNGVNKDVAMNSCIQYWALEDTFCWTLYW